MASLFVRTYTFVDGTTAYGSQVETEFENLSVTLNNLNTGVANWGQISVLNATSVPLIADCGGGTQDIADFKNNSVTKGYINSNGEYVVKAAGFGFIFTTPDGTKTFRIYIDNNGILTTIEVT